MAKKILFLLHLPPPSYGVTIFNQNLLSANLKDYFHIDPVAINTAQNISQVGKKSLSKSTIFFKIFFKILRKLLKNKYHLCYCSLTPTGIGFYKDLFYVLLIKIFKVKTLYHLHGKGISARRGFINRILYKWCFQNTKVILISAALLYDVQEYVNYKDIYIVPNGIVRTLSEQDFKELQHKRRVSKPITLLFLSNMIK
ncbi:MAG: glycosyltransferase family 1 protein, partial [Candidatus Omnitrophota bacterium]